MMSSLSLFSAHHLLVSILERLNQLFLIDFDPQSFYAYLIHKYRPELLDDTTDHGYPPKYLLKPAALLWVGSSNIWSRFQRRITHYQEFRPQKWMRVFYTGQIENLLRYTGISSNKYKDHLANGEYLSNLVDFDKISALQLWLSILEIG